MVSVSLCDDVCDQCIYVFRRADAVHHYKILQSGNMWKFERAVSALFSPTHV